MHRTHRHALPLTANHRTRLRDRGRSVSILTTFLGALVCNAAVFAAETGNRTKAEIAHLFAYLQSSGCQFFRNGKWYASTAAVEHLKKKHEYLSRKELVATTELFIARGASESSTSGKPYLVRCAEGPALESRKWFTDELARFRKGS